MEYPLLSIDKDLTLHELEMIYNTLKDNVYFTNCSVKAIVGRKTYLTPKHENVLLNYSFKTKLANYIIEVIVFLINRTMGIIRGSIIR
jgi:hypothetical protein